MESAAILSPCIKTRPVFSGRTSVCVKLLSNHRWRPRQCIDTACHRWWLKRLDSVAIQSVRTEPPSWQIFSATLEGNVDLEEFVTEGASKNELEETENSPKEDSKNTGTNLDAFKQGREPWQSNKPPPWVRRKITVDFDALQPGDILTGKVTNTQRFGAFVDVGAWNSGLIHISNLSDKFVSSVDDIVKVGQEVRVEVVSVSIDTKRLSLKLLREEDPAEVVAENSMTASTQPAKVRSRRRMQVSDKKGSLKAAGKPQKGEVVTGSVAKISPNGIIVTLTEGHQGFLPATEVLSGGQSVDTSSFFRIGQQIPVRVLRTARDRIVLTMKKQETINEMEASEEEVRATNPFEIAFRQNKVIAKYLEDRERTQNPSTGAQMDENPAVQSSGDTDPLGPGKKY